MTRRVESLGGVRIVVIDDDVDACEILHLLLARHGAELAIAHDGAGGLAKAREHRAEIVVCDLALPDMSGHAVLHQLRSWSDAPRCIAVSGYALTPPHQFDGYLRKPVDIHELIALIAELVPPRP